MNIKNAHDYSIGLDLGTNSVGWAVTDSEGNLYNRYDKSTLGSRLFSEGKTAADTRLKRGQRRRYNRRRQRIECLQGVFAAEMAAVDPEFFTRLRYSSLVSDDRLRLSGLEFGHPIFDDATGGEHDYYDRFPTIWHLRKWLMETDQKSDIRLIYLALHNIVKRRGNFLHEDEKGLSAANANSDASVALLIDALLEYADACEGAIGSVSPSKDKLIELLDNSSMSRAEGAEEFQAALGMSNKNIAKAIARACFDYEVEWSTIIVDMEKGESTKFKCSNDEKLEIFESACPDDAQNLLQAVLACYSSHVLSCILKGGTGLSAAMVKSYEQHKDDLRTVKDLIQDYLDVDAYRKMFRGPRSENGAYDINELPKGSYTAYIAGEKLANKKGCSYDDFIKNLRKVLFSNESLMQDGRYKQIEGRLNAEPCDFLAKQKTCSNGAIPYQLHMEEMDAIIESQGKYYPFLLENKDLLDRVVGSRIPYYVGPINTQHDPEGPYKNSIDSSRKFGWAKRREGMEGVPVYPWNVEEVIDTDETAERFIRRMTGTCTYLYGEPVVPRCSLLYEEFCVLNELNGARWGESGGELHRFDWCDREDMLEELFKGRKAIKYAAVVDWLKGRETVKSPVISGTQAEDGFESKLNSYNDFCKILGVKRLEDSDCPLSIEQIEQIILWNTVFEDRDILKRKLKASFGDVLTDKQMRQIVKKRYTGWGRLSSKFLTEIKASTPFGPMSIMDIMREGDPTAGRHRRAMNLMEILRDKEFGFQERIDKINEDHFEGTGSELCVDDLQGSPALHRSVNQAMRVIEDIVSLTGEPPARICIEVTREEDEKKKGKRTDSRYKALDAAYKKLKDDATEFDPEVLNELKANKEKLSREALMLYFMQNGKCLYSGRPLNISRLSEECEVDHILPQCYIKDDSLDNKALVFKDENQRKLDSLLLDNSIIQKRRVWWSALNRAGLISDKKYRNLTRTRVSDEAMKGFINRQLVETSQIVKFVRQLCEQKYPTAHVVSVKASLGHELRERCGLVKCRDFNNYHHAHDAYIACEIARFIDLRYPKWQDGFDRAMIESYLKGMSSSYGKTRRMPGRSGFIVDSFLRDGFDKETGEVFRDSWDASVEIARIRRVMGYKKIFITRMQEEQTGSLWDETVYSPRDGKNGKNLMPLKGYGTDAELDSEKYGGYNKVQQACFFAFRAIGARGNWKDFFEGVPIHLAKKVASSPETLKDYAEQIAAANGCHGAQILRAKVPLRQKFEMDGSTFYLYGRSNKSNEVRSAMELAGDLDFAGLIRSAQLGLMDVSEDRCKLQNKLIDAAGASCPKLAAALNITEVFNKAFDCNKEDYGTLVLNICKVFEGKTQGCDLRLVGRSMNTGFMLIGMGSNLHSITWIDESPTGMYSHRTTYEDLTHGL